MAVLSLKKVTGKDFGNDVNRWQQYVRGETPPPPSWGERFLMVLTDANGIFHKAMCALQLLPTVKAGTIADVPIVPCPLQICSLDSSRFPEQPTKRGEGPHGGGEPMQPIRFTEQFKKLITIARQLTETAEAEAILLLLEGPTDWSRLRSVTGKGKVVVAANTSEELAGTKRLGWRPSASTCPTARSTNA